MPGLPARDIRAAEHHAMKRKFVEEFGITHRDEMGRSGICQQTFPEKGFALPGTLIVGMDSHTISYCAFNAAATAIRAAEAYYVLLPRDKLMG